MAIVGRNPMEARGEKPELGIRYLPMAFMECASLATITIGNGVTSIGDLAFWDCSSLAGVYFKGIWMAADVGRSDTCSGNG